MPERWREGVTMADRHPGTGEGRLALALLTTAGGLGVLAASVITLLPVVIVTSVIALAAGPMRHRLAGVDSSRVLAPLAAWWAPVRRQLSRYHAHGWHRPPMEGRPI